MVPQNVIISTKELKLKIGKVAPKMNEQQLGKKRIGYFNTMTHRNFGSSALYIEKSSVSTSTISTFQKVHRSSADAVLPDCFMPVGCLSI